MKNISRAALLAFLLLSPTSLTNVIAETHSPYWHQKVTLFDRLPIQANDIVFLGNSITDGGEFAELFKNDNIKNRGINSDVILGVEERLGQVTKGKPSKIFLLIGINDISHNLPVKTLADRYEKLVKEIRQQSPETKLYLQSIMPINNSFGRYKNLKGKENTIIELNKKI
ncbi:MAG: sialate O-acetylesterase, partial [Muribaculaceae bacterium]|nr:sialate O-acetylesterase [Muribaculaceae bacterium]